MFTWDNSKRVANLLKHGFDFSDASLVYDDERKITLVSTRNRESRLMDIALVEAQNVVVVLIYLPRGNDIQVISMRRASRKGRRLYGCN